MLSATRRLEVNMWKYMAYLPAAVSSTTFLAKAEYWLMCGNVPDATFNFVTRARHCTEKSVTEAIAFFAAKQLPFDWWTSPSDTPAHLPNILNNHGLICTAVCPALYLPLSKLQHKTIPPHFTAQKVVSYAHLQDFIHVISSIHAPEATQKYYNAAADVLLGTPNCPATLYVGYAANLPVSALFLFEDKISETAGIYSVATLPSHRHQGFASALTQIALHEAAQRGAKLATLQATAAGLPLYKRLGFMECGEVLAFSFQTPDSQ